MADIRVIKSSLGDDATLAEWETSIGANPTVDQIGSIEEDYDVGAVVINATNTNAVELKVTVAAGFRFYEGAGWSTDMDTVAGAQGARISQSAAAHAIYVNTTDHVFIEYLNLQVTGSGFDAIFANGADNLIVRYCLLDGRDGGQGQAFYARGAGSGVTIYRCWCMGAAADSGGAGVVYFRDLDQSYLVHVAVWNETDGTGILNRNSDIYASNNFSEINGSTGQCYRDGSGTVNWTTGSGYNGASDASGPGTNSFDNVSGFYVSTSAGTEDLHMASGNDGTYEGQDDTSGYGSIDPEQDTVVEHDIGADEYVAAAGGGSTPLFMHHYKMLANA